jgi:hypothetical protein
MFGQHQEYGRTLLKNINIYNVYDLCYFQRRLLYKVFFEYMNNALRKYILNSHEHF